MQQQINQSIKKFSDNGILKALEEKWIADNDEKIFDTMVASNGDKEPIRIGVTGNLPPMDYAKADGTPAGYSVALMQEIAKELNRSVEFVPVDTGARLTALASENIDIAFWFMSAVESSELPKYEGYVFTDSYFKDRSVFVTKDYPAEEIRKFYKIEQ